MSLGLQQTIVGGGSNDAHERLTGEFIERSVLQPDISFAEGIEQLALAERLCEATPLFRFDARTMVRGRRIKADKYLSPAIPRCGSIVTVP